jgi:predicted O-linked N-acetylglucosamine transferase (SPINDLY family)
MPRCDNREALKEARRHHLAGRLVEAEAGYRAVAGGSDVHPDALNLLGVLCLQMARDEEALTLLRQAVGSRTDFPEAFNNLGVVLEGRGELRDAEDAYRRAIASRPAYVDALNNLGNTLKKIGRLPEAGHAHREALRHRPSHPLTHACLGAVALEQGNLDEALTHYWRASSLQPKNPAAHSDLLFWLLHHPRYTPRQWFDAHRTWAKRHAEPLRAHVKPHDNDPAPHRPLRVGYVSPDFREHPVARFFEPVLANHDPTRVVSVCYSDAIRPDDVTRRLRAQSAEWRETAGLADAALADRVRADRIDLLVDLSGQMGGNRLLVFARKPAPVQVTYLGYPHSTGLDAIDYRITDAGYAPDVCLASAHLFPTSPKGTEAACFHFAPAVPGPPVTPAGAPARA